MNLHELLESTVYHTTKLRYCAHILKSNALLATSQSNGRRAVSVSRDKAHIRMYLEDQNYVRFGLNKRLLRTKYKLTPYSENENAKDGQFEEHILGDVHPLSKYLLSVELVLNTKIQENELDSYELVKTVLTKESS